MKIRLRRSVGAWTRGRELTVPQDINKVDAAKFVYDLKVADEIEAKGNAVPRPGASSPSKALPSGGPVGSVSASSLSPADRARPAPIGAGPLAPRRRARPAS